jgi:Subtilase family
LSEIIARDDATGMVGAAPNARASVISYFRPGLSLAKNPVAEVYDSILLAIASLFFGDVLLLEVQFEDKVGGGSSTNVPVETDPHVFEAMKLATKCGVIVVEAAGNGTANLDLFVGRKGPDKGKTVFLKGAQNQFKDSGAIMVGASTSTFPLQRWPGSNFGSRVDCYSWGENIVACGFNPKQANVFWGVPGQIVNYGGKDLSNAPFGGTSGASPVIVGCCLLVQNLQTLMTPKSGVKGSLGPERMRQMLANDMNGSRSFLTTDQIGVMPDLRKIIANEFV